MTNDSTKETAPKDETNMSSPPTDNNNTSQAPPIPQEPKSTATEDLERIAIELEKPYLYQNRRTGRPSSSPLTARQLCRLLCPAVNHSVMRSTTMSVTPETLVIGFDIRTGQYSSDGWMAANKTPVLREACATWHYEANDNGVGVGVGDEKGRIKGPISCRELASIIMSQRSQTKKEHQNSLENIRVWSTEMAQEVSKSDKDQQQQQQQWMKISELIFLKAAMEAFEDTPPIWSLEEQSNGDNKKTKTMDNNNNSGGDASTTNMAAEGDFDPSVMTYDADNGASSTNKVDQKQTETADNGEKGKANNNASNTNNNGLSAKENEELEAFLSSTADMGPAHGKGNNEDDDDDEEGYESDGGTSYVKDLRTGNWIHAALAPPKKPTKPKETAAPNNKKSDANNNTNANTINNNNKKRKRKTKFSAKNAKCWVYVTGLPTDTNEDEVATYFARAGVLDLDPSTQHSKVKLYREKTDDAKGKNGKLKGDASVCYARPESVDMALQFLDDSLFRADSTMERIKVQRAKFEQHGAQFFEEKKGRFSESQRKVARLAALQAVGWDDGENGRITGGKKGLRIIVLKNMFHPDELLTVGKGGRDGEVIGESDEKEDDDAALMELEREVHTECEKYGVVEKITVFSKNPSGIMIVKFAQPGAASDAISEYHGRTRKGRKVDASFWDGVTDYTVQDAEKEQKEMDQRHDEFGSWLESQEVPEEFQLKVEGGS